MTRIGGRIGSTVQVEIRGERYATATTVGIDNTNQRDRPMTADSPFLGRRCQRPVSTNRKRAPARNENAPVVCLKLAARPKQMPAVAHESQNRRSRFERVSNPEKHSAIAKKLAYGVVDTIQISPDITTAMPYTTRENVGPAIFLALK
jgi:hypothetical protein